MVYTWYADVAHISWRCQTLKGTPIELGMTEEQYIETDGSENRYFSDEAMTVLHREDGPAVEYANGGKLWYLNGKLHREDGPAAEFPGGYKAWYINNKLHREDGPARELPDGHEAWYLNGECMNEEEFNTHMSIFI